MNMIDSGMDVFAKNQKKVQPMWFLKWVFLLIPNLLMLACSGPGHEFLVYIGTYTGSGSDGIYSYRFHPENGDLKPLGLVAKTDNPSFFIIDPDRQFLYAVNEVDTFQQERAGAVSVFKINRRSGKLTLLQKISSLGAAPAHISLDKTARNLLVSNYNGGNAAVFPIKENGLIGSHTAFIQNVGSSVDRNRQAAPHAHFIQATNDNRFVMIADLGTDQVLVFSFDPELGSLSPIDARFVKLAPGSGPRHLAFAPNGKYVYVINELVSTITVFSLEPESGTMEEKQTISTLPAEYSGMNTTAEILVDAKGRFLYVSNRGHDSIGVFSIHADDNSLEPVEWISSGGKTPRHFEIDPSGQWLFAANQDSDNIVLFQIDEGTGRLIQTSQLVEVADPVCVQFLSLK